MSLIADTERFVDSWKVTYQTPPGSGDWWLFTWKGKGDEVISLSLTNQWPPPLTVTPMTNDLMRGHLVNVKWARWRNRQRLLLLLCCRVVVNKINCLIILVFSVNIITTVTNLSLFLFVNNICKRYCIFVKFRFLKYISSDVPTFSS